MTIQARTDNGAFLVNANGSLQSECCCGIFAPTNTDGTNDGFVADVRNACANIIPWPGPYPGVPSDADPIYYWTIGVAFPPFDTMSIWLWRTVGGVWQFASERSLGFTYWIDGGTNPGDFITPVTLVTAGQYAYISAETRALNAAPGETFRVRFNGLPCDIVCNCTSEATRDGWATATPQCAYFDDTAPFIHAPSDADWELISQGTFPNGHMWSFSFYLRSGTYSYVSFYQVGHTLYNQNGNITPSSFVDKFGCSLPVFTTGALNSGGHGDYRVRYLGDWCAQ